MNPTVSQKKAALSIVFAVSEAIREAKTIPAGTLYAVLMSTVDKRGFDRIIDMLKNTGLVREQNFLLTWTGPEVN